MEKFKNRKQREQESRRWEIMDAALDLLHQKGFHQTTVQEIADAAEFGVGTIYRLFPGGKDELYHAWQEVVVETWEEELAGALSGAENRMEAVRRYIRAAARVYERHPRAMAVYLRDAASVGSDLARGLRSDLAERYIACADKARQALEMGMQAGEFKRLSPEAGAAALRAMINGVFLHWLENESETTAEENAELIENMFFYGVKRTASWDW